MKKTCQERHDYTTNNNGDYINSVLFSEEEIEVSNILLELPFLITKPLSSHRFAYNWNTKKLRSAVVSRFKLGQKASSPTTPLYFSPTDSNVKSKKRKLQPPKTRKIDELEAVLKEGMDTQEELKDTIEKVKLYRKKLIIENSELKAKKQKLLVVNLGEEREKTMQPLLQLQRTPVNDPVHAGSPMTAMYQNQVPLIFHQISGVNDPVYVSPSTPTQFQQHHGPLINHHDPCPSTTAMQFHYPSPLIPHQHYAVMINQPDPVFRRQRGNSEFDLNMVPEDDFTMMTHKMNVKAMAAAARQKRIHANKNKKTRVKP